MRWPPVSVVMPTRGRPEYLTRAVSSVLAQDYLGEVECLVVFDQEPIRPVAVHVPARRRLTALSNQRSPGLAGARNTGALIGSGDWLAFLDDDDEWLPDKLTCQLSLARAQPQADLLGCGIEIRRGGRTFQRAVALSDDPWRDLLRSRHAAFHPSTFVVRRNVLLECVGLFDEQIPGGYAEDYEWLLRAARRVRLAWVDRPLVRIHWGSQSHFSQRWDMVVEGLIYLVRKRPEFAQEPRGLARIYGQIAFAHAAQGEAAQARRWSRRSLSASLFEPRAYLAWLVSYRLMKADAVTAMLANLGRRLC